MLLRTLGRRWASAGKLKAQRKLHPAAKYKRVLSQCDYWFGAANLATDDLLLLELASQNGWCRLSTLARFPRFRYWGTEDILEEAFQVPGAERYEYYEGRVRPHKPFATFRPSRLAATSDWGRRATIDDLQAIEEAPLHDDRERLVQGIEANLRERMGRFASHLSPNPFYYQELKNHLLALQRPPREARTRKEYGDLPLFSHPARIAVAWTPETIVAALAPLHQERTLGFDVEYATLETDLRLLPAMVQLASLEHVALVWLDKLPDHGAEALRPEEPLGALLADADAAKVGVGATADAANLESFSHGHLRCQTVLEVAPDSHEVSLADLVAADLGRRLPKRKVAPRSSRKKAHWRAPCLTAAMKRYAAEDALASLLVWRARN